MPKQRTKRLHAYRFAPKTAKQLTRRLALLIILLTVLTSWRTLKWYRQALQPYRGGETVSFIASISQPAQSVANKHQLYPSVMLAQAILESHKGQSQLSQKPYYNFFGIKGDYRGKSVILPTSEDDGTGQLYQVDAAFRAYGSPARSFEDYAMVLSDPLYQNTHKQIGQSYHSATASLTGTYATDSHYQDKLNALIEQYQLTLFDFVE
ncbi:glycoside hydrolase family 73 protein [Streptococcus halichoeri]|uniref:glycoside hydrolase family 73 protein n=1 Tax=Streptococcus halichoeri TaxID=254785 RepID=UPI001356B835|nr:glycoside hydrolase family 73 protein [Streptococcus halichoeri]